jgi:hypothetical protein
MTTTRTELGTAVAEDAANVVAECRRLAKVHGSGQVRARLAQLAEYAELIAERLAGGEREPIAYHARLNGMD